MNARNGVLEEEAGVLQVQALAAKGELPQAKSLARHLLASSPGGILAARLRAMIDDGIPTDSKRTGGPRRAAVGIVLGALVRDGQRVRDPSTSISRASLQRPGTAACTTVSAALAQVRGIHPSPMAIDDDYLYVVASTTGGDPNTEDLWRIPKDGSSPGRSPSTRPASAVWSSVRPGRMARPPYTGRPARAPSTPATPERSGRSGPVPQDRATILVTHRSAPGALLEVDSAASTGPRNTSIRPGRSTAPS